MKTFKRLLSYLKDEPLFYGLGFVLSIISAGSTIYTPMMANKSLMSFQITLNKINRSLTNS